MKYYVAKIKLKNGKTYEKLVGGVSKNDALKRVTSWQTEGQIVEAIRKCKKTDIGTFFQGCR